MNQAPYVRTDLGQGIGFLLRLIGFIWIAAFGLSLAVAFVYKFWWAIGIAILLYIHATGRHRE